MSADYRIDSNRRIVFITCQGALAVEDLEQLTVQLRRDALFNPDFPLLVDLSGVSSISSSFDAIHRYASDPRNDAFSFESRRAVVAPQSLTFGIARMYEALRDQRNLPLKIFRSMPEALQWLGWRVPE